MYYLIIALFLCGSLNGATVCLNMIIKNEEKVIERCLNSVKPFIDYWVIVDTGSGDRTMEIVRETMKGIPGELHQGPWVNFEHNRNEALDYAKGKSDYILFIDADDALEYAPDFSMPILTKDFYHIESLMGGTKYKRVQLVKDKLNWRWKGVLHEALYSTQARTSAVLTGVAMRVRHEGARSQDPLKFAKDAAVLEKALKEDPNNTRYQFYYAQSLKDGKEYEKALKAYEKRFGMGGWSEELFQCLYQIALIKEILEYPTSDVIAAYKTAYLYRPTRAEPLYHLARFLRSKGDFKEAVKVASQGIALKQPPELLFVENWIYEYGLLFEYSISSYWIENYLESLIASRLVIENKTTPDNITDRVKKNLVFVYEKLDQKGLKAGELLGAGR